FALPKWRDGLTMGQSATFFHRTMTPIRLQPQHAAQYRQFMLDAYAIHPDAFTSTVAERASAPLSFWQTRMAGGEAASDVVFGIFTGTDAAQLAGVVGLQFASREKVKHKAHLFGMMVAPQMRHRGLGDALVQAALDYAATRPGVKLVQLTVTDGNRAAQALYARHGFVAFGLEPMAVSVGDGFVAKLHMWRAL
ncbi:MAG: hypothetical protein RL748_4163, partial [Pseudomonadota bacterium]